MSCLLLVLLPPSGQKISECRFKGTRELYLVKTTVWCLLWLWRSFVKRETEPSPFFFHTVMSPFPSFIILFLSFFLIITYCFKLLCLSAPTPLLILSSLHQWAVKPTARRRSLQLGPGHFWMTSSWPLAHRWPGYWLWLWSSHGQELPSFSLICLTIKLWQVPSAVCFYCHF